MHGPVVRVWFFSLIPRGEGAGMRGKAGRGVGALGCGD